MRSLLTVLFLLLSFTLKAANGDITGVNIMPNGWIAEITITNVSTNGTYSLGLGTSNTITGSEKVIFNMTDLGYDATGTPITVQRKVYGTKECRWPYPDQASKFDQDMGSAVTVVRLALSDFIFTKTSNLTMTASASFYTGGTANNATNAITCTNASTVPYPRVISNWGGVPHQITTGGAFTLRVLAFHDSAKYFDNGKQGIAAVKFWSRDTSGNTNAPVFVTSSAIDRTQGDAVGVIEYTNTFSDSTFAQGVVITNYYAAYPLIGDSFIDCMDGSNNSEQMQSGPFLLVCDKNGTYGRCYGNVDGVNGGSGVIATNTTQVSDGTMTPFLTVGAMMNALALTNFFVFGHSNWSNGYGYITNENNTAWCGATVTTRDDNPVWFTLTRHPNVTAAQAIIQTNTSNQNIQKNSKIRFFDLTINWANSGSLASTGHRAVWFDTCTVQSNANSGTTIAAFHTNGWLTHCSVARMRGGYAMSTLGSVTGQRWHIRGNTFTSQLDACKPYVFIGNLVNPATNSQHVIANDAGGSLFADPWIGAFNEIYKADTASVTMGTGLNATNISFGIAWIQNMMERVSTGANNPIYDIMTSTIAGEYLTNFLSWNNTIISAVYHPPFNHTTNIQNYIGTYADVSNIYDYLSVLYDTGSGSPGPNGTRTNRWSRMFSVGCYGNWMGNYISSDSTPESTGAQGNFGFNGLETAFVSTNRMDLYLKYTNSKAFQIGDAAAGVGGGSYWLLSGSPAFNNKTAWVLPWDLHGVYRGKFDPPGAYASGNVKKGGFF